MRKEVKPVDFDLLKKCCSELGMELVPAASSDCITLTDEQGNKVRVTTEDNIFDYDFKE